MARTNPPQRGKDKPKPHLKPHRWVKGCASPNPAGRPKGQIDRVHKLQLEALATGATPLQILLAIARKDAKELATMGLDPRECDLIVRKSAAEAALPYTHRKMPQQLDIEVARSSALEEFKRLMEFMTDEELTIFVAAQKRLEALPLNGGVKFSALDALVGQYNANAEDIEDVEPLHQEAA